jgi:hypothetical protein
MISATEFTPLQGLILLLSIVGIFIEIYLMYRDKNKYLLEVPCLLLLSNMTLFYGWLLVTSPYDRNASFVWSQFIRLHTVVTVLLIAYYRVANLSRKENVETSGLDNIRNGFANARDGLSNIRDEQANARDARLERKDRKHG